MARISLPKQTPNSFKKWTLILVSFLSVHIIFVWLEDIPETVLLPDPNSENEPSNSVKPEEVLNHPEMYLYPRTCSKQGATIADVRACYPDAPIQQPWLYKGSACASQDETSPLTWKFLQDCISGRRTTGKITQIHVIGERNSGTKWLQQELEQCFPRKVSGVRSHRDFLRSKHFFQPPARGNFENSLVVAIVRDPIEWAAAMREKPYHMPQHMNGFDTTSKRMPAIPLEWQEFIQRPWTLPQRTPDDMQIINKQQTDTIRCAQGFSFDEVMPCYFDNSTLPRAKWRGHVPIYELRRDHSGKPFDDLLKLRSEKALNFFLEVPLLMQMGGFLAVRYDDLVKHGTKSFLEKVAKHMLGTKKLPVNCRPQPPRPERLGQRKIPAAFRKWIEDHMVAETEHMLGYR